MITYGFNQSSKLVFEHAFYAKSKRNAEQMGRNGTAKKKMKNKMITFDLQIEFSFIGRF